MSAVSATASVPTTKASKYLQQACKHWEHNLAVEFTPDHGTILFPKSARGADWPADGLVTFDAGVEALAVRIDAVGRGAARGTEGGSGAASRAFRVRGAPLAFDWLAGA
jgi:hypothetical protein